MLSFPDIPAASPALRAQLDDQVGAIATLS